MQEATASHIRWGGAGGKGSGDLRASCSSDSFVTHTLIKNLIKLTLKWEIAVNNYLRSFLKQGSQPSEVIKTACHI